MNDTDSNVIDLRASTEEEKEVEFQLATKDEIDALQEAAIPFYYAAHLLAERGVPGSMINSAALFVVTQLLALNTSPEFAAEQLHTMADKVLAEYPNDLAGQA